MEPQDITPTDDNAQSNGTGTTPKSENANEGFQKRIDEMTAQLRATERQRDELTAALAQSVTQDRQTVQQVAEPKVTDPFANVNWGDENSVKGAFTGALNQVTQSLRNEMHQQIRGITGQVATTEVQRIAQSLNLAPSYLEAAENIIRNAKKDGLPITPSDAVDFVVGKAIREGKDYKVKVRDFRSGGDGGPQYTNPGNPPPRQTVGELPKDFDNLSPTKQIELLEARGIHDKPF